jgi:hypothetical protein
VLRLTKNYNSYSAIFFLSYIILIFLVNFIGSFKYGFPRELDVVIGRVFV